MQDAYQIALKMLNARPMTAQEVRKKLADKNFSPEDICEALKKLKEYNFINDELYADTYIKYGIKLKKKGGNYLKHKLIQKGVDREIIESILSELPRNEEFETAMALAKNRVKSKKVDDKLVAGTASFLRSRGFSEDIIYKVIKQIRFGNEE